MYFSLRSEWILLIIIFSFSKLLLMYKIDAKWLTNYSGHLCSCRLGGELEHYHFPEAVVHLCQTLRDPPRRTSRVWHVDLCFLLLKFV